MGGHVLVECISSGWHIFRMAYLQDGISYNILRYRQGKP